MKVCTKCHVEKPEEAFAMQQSRGRRRAECRECKAIADKEWLTKRKQNPVPKPDTQKCKQCGEVKAIERFSPNSTAGYFHSRCRDCENHNRQEKRQEQYKNDPTGRFYWPFANKAGVVVKRCTYCHKEKPLSEFYRNGTRGYHGKCKVCDKTLKQNEYKAHPEKYRDAVLRSARKYPDRVRARFKRWDTAHRAHRTQYQRKLLVAHPERVVIYNQTRRSRYTYETGLRWRANSCESAIAWRAANKDRLREQSRVYRKANPHKHADTQNRRRARKLASPRIERIHRKAIIERDKWTCYLCGIICTPQTVTLDHVIPLYRGGAHASDNLRVACRSCNSRKGTKLLHDFLR